ncbi:MAG: HD domain-containing protein [Rhodospirillales bacterium]|nr:HD domain-containing protein [Rhodospirillales bacterium]
MEKGLFIHFDFDFATDETCQTVFKPFIEEELARLAAYDAQRQDTTDWDITYIFHEHAQRVAENIYRTCLALGMSEADANTMRWAVLPHDIGKRLLPVDLWDQEEKPSGRVKKVRRLHTLLGAQIVEEMFPDIDHPFKDLMIEIMRYHHEQMDGCGPHEAPGDQLSTAVRLVAIVEAYDGWRIWRPHFGDRDISPPGVLKRMREEKGAEIFDMDLFEVFAKVMMDDYKKGRIYKNRDTNMS